MRHPDKARELRSGRFAVVVQVRRLVQELRNYFGAVLQGFGIVLRVESGAACSELRPRVLEVVLPNLEVLPVVVRRKDL